MSSRAIAGRVARRLALPVADRAPKGDAAAPVARLERGGEPWPLGDRAAQEGEVHLADDLGMALGDSVEGTVAQAYGVAVGVGLVASFAQQRLEVGAGAGLVRELASEILGGLAQCPARVALRV